MSINYPYPCYSKWGSHSPVIYFTTSHSSSYVHHSCSANHCHHTTAPVSTSPISQDIAISKFLVNTIQLGLLVLGKEANPSTFQLLVDNIISTLNTVTNPPQHPQMETTEQKFVTIPATSLDSMDVTPLQSSDFPPLPRPSTSEKVKPQQPSQASSTGVIPWVDSSSSHSHEIPREVAPQQPSSNTSPTIQING